VSSDDGYIAGVGSWVGFGDVLIYMEAEVIFASSFGSRGSVAGMLGSGGV